MDPDTLDNHTDQTRWDCVVVERFSTFSESPKVGHHPGKEHEQTVGVSLFLCEIRGANVCQQSECQSSSTI